MSEDYNYRMRKERRKERSRSNWGSDWNWKLDEITSAFLKTIKSIDINPRERDIVEKATYEYVMRLRAFVDIEREKFIMDGLDDRYLLREAATRFGYRLFPTDLRPFVPPLRGRVLG